MYVHYHVILIYYLCCYHYSLLLYIISYFFLPTYDICIVKSQLIVRFLFYLFYKLFYWHIFTAWLMSPWQRLLDFFVDENKALVKGRNILGSNHVVF